MVDANQGALSPMKHEAAPLRRGISLAIRQAIEVGTLANGARLVERDLCEQLNVSRTSLRESLRELEADGIIGREGRHLVVVKISRLEAKNVYRVRERLEALVAEQFAENPNPEKVENLREIVVELSQAYVGGQMERIIEAKYRFYEALCLGADNNVVLDILNRINARVSQLRSASLSSADRWPLSIAEIDVLVEAIAAGDPATARAAAETHVRNAAAAAFGSEILGK